MKISIIGPSGSGKSHLANILSQKLNIPHSDLDEILFQFENPAISRALSERDFLPKLYELINTEDWIIEGLHPFDNVFMQVDFIIRIKASASQCIYQQWKRFATNPRRRRKYGLWNNIKLSIYILRQFYEVPTLTTDPRRTWVKSIDNILKHYDSKVINYEKGMQVSMLLNQIETAGAERHRFLPHP